MVSTIPKNKSQEKLLGFISAGLLFCFICYDKWKKQNRRCNT